MGFGEDKDGRGDTSAFIETDRDEVFITISSDEGLWLATKAENVFVSLPSAVCEDMELIDILRCFKNLTTIRVMASSHLNVIRMTSG